MNVNNVGFENAFQGLSFEMTADEKARKALEVDMITRRLLGREGFQSKNWEKMIFCNY